MTDNEMMEVDSNVVENFPFNFDCAFELFEHLGFDECMNLAEAYDDLRPIANRMYKRKFNKLSFNFRQRIDRILRHAGPTAQSLTLTIDEGKCTTRTLNKISHTCKQVRCLTIKGLQRELFHGNPFISFNKGQIEMLTLNGCSLAYDIHFFDGYKSLKCLNMFCCYETHATKLVRCFKNNPQMNSFTWNDMCFQVPQMLLLLKNLERLSLYYRTQYMTLDMLSGLPLLRHLTLICRQDNIDYILADLAKSKQLEELVLVNLVIEERTFPLMKSLQHLKLLSITTSNGVPFPTYNVLPKNLMKLKLEGFRITNGNIAPVIQRLPHLENILLKNCKALRNELWVSDFDSMVGLIVEDLTGKHIHRNINVAVEVKGDDSTEKVKSVGRVRITNYVENKSIFEIQYPGLDGLLPETICEGVSH